MSHSKSQFIDFLIKHQALKFGEFTLKSGRVSPYFFNLGVFNTGESLTQLGQFYAQALIDSGFAYDVLFGPAYKGIPLVSTTAISLFNDHQINTPYCFNRKEAKAYGDGGTLVGAPLNGNIVMLDDVITAGTTVKETLALMKQHDAHLSGIIIAFDRQERGQGTATAVQDISEQHGISIKSVLSLDDLLAYLDNKPEYASVAAKIISYQTP